MKRDISKIDAEYDKDKYAKLLDYYLSHPSMSMLQLKEHEFGLPNDLASTLRRQCDTTLMRVSYLMGSFDSLIELGCGYGYNLYWFTKMFPSKLIIGGDYSQNAVKLGNLLGIGIMPFNFYDETWNIMERVKGKTIIFTRHAIEQLPKASPFVSTLSKYRDKIDKIIHLEPVYELHPMTIQGKARREFTIRNDYNTDLLTEIIKQGGKIEYQEYDVGVDPLNPTSILVWR